MKRGARYEAPRSGEKYYFTGKPCSRGHIALRYVSSFECVECSRRQTKKSKKAIYDAKRYLELAPSVRERVDIWARNNPERAREVARVTVSPDMVREAA